MPLIRCVGDSEMQVGKVMIAPGGGNGDHARIVCGGDINGGVSHKGNLLR